MYFRPHPHPAPLPRVWMHGTFCWRKLHPRWRRGYAYGLLWQACNVGLVNSAATQVHVIRALHVCNFTEIVHPIFKTLFYLSTFQDSFQPWTPRLESSRTRWSLRKRVCALWWVLSGFTTLLFVFSWEKLPKKSSYYFFSSCRVWLSRVRTWALRCRKFRCRWSLAGTCS